MKPISKFSHLFNKQSNRNYKMDMTTYYFDYYYYIHTNVITIKTSMLQYNIVR